MKMSLLFLFVFSILFKFDVFAQRTVSSKDQCGSECWTFAPGGKFYCGNNYCSGAACTKRSGWKLNPSPTSNADRCIQAEAEEQSPSTTGNTSLRCVAGATESNEGGEIICTCPGGVAVKPGESCNAPAAATAPKQCEGTGVLGRDDGTGFVECICDSTNGYSRDSSKTALTCIKAEADNKPTNGDSSKIAACETRGGKWEENESGRFSCFCSGGRGIDPAGTQNCSDFVAKATPTSAQTQKAATDCLETLKNNIKTCGTDAKKAVEDCNAITQSNKSYSESAKLIQGVGTILTARKAGSGDVSECAKAALGSAGAYLALDMMKGDCDEIRTTCEKSCDPIKNFVERKDSEKDNQLSICREQYVANKSASFGYDPGVEFDTQVKPKITVMLTELYDEAQKGFKKCSIESKKNEDAMLNLLNNANQATQVSAQCACSQSSTGTNCTNIPSPAECKDEPTKPGCPELVSMMCQQGTAEYSTRTCICYREPNNAVCTVTTGGSANKIAGVGPGAGANNVAGLGNTTLPSYKGPNGRDDFNIDSDMGRGSSGALNGNGAAGGTPFTSAQNPGGGGGGGLGAGGASSGLEEGQEDDSGSKGGIGGLFSQMRGIADKMFGGGANGSGGKNSDDKNKKSGKEVDPNKWLARGIAGGTGMGGKNGDIWKQMNTQYLFQSKSPVTFLSPEGK